MGFITLKNVRANEKNYAHTNVFNDSKPLGYFMRNQSGNAACINENWNFVSKSELPNFYTKTKNEMLNKLNILTK